MRYLRRFVLIVFLGACASSNAEVIESAAAAALGFKAESFALGRSVAFETTVEQAKGSCMRDGGFEYVEISIDVSNIRQPVSDDPDSYAEDFGFGISTSLLESGAESPLPPPSEINANVDIVEALSSLERDAWLTKHEACRLAGLDVGTQTIQILDPVRSLVQQSAERAMADPRSIDAGKRWVECMGEAGFPQSTSDPNEVHLPFVERAKEFDARLNRDTVEIDAVQDVSAELRAEIEATARLEVGTAVANRRCTESYYPIVDEIINEYEAATVEDHEAVFDTVSRELAEATD